MALDGHIAAAESELPKILCGDFNATPDSDEIRFLRGLHTSAGRRTVWQDAWERRHGRADGFTWARANPYTARLRWLDRDRRLDYISVSLLKRDGRGVIHDCRIVLDRAAADGALPSDHSGSTPKFSSRRSKRKPHRDEKAGCTDGRLAPPPPRPSTRRRSRTPIPGGCCASTGEFVEGFDALADIGAGGHGLRLGAHHADDPLVRSGARDSARLLAQGGLRRHHRRRARASWRRPTAARSRRAALSIGCNIELPFEQGVEPLRRRRDQLPLLLRAQDDVRQVRRRRSSSSPAASARSTSCSRRSR